MIMISSFAHQINELERKISEQTQLLEQIHGKIPADGWNGISHAVDCVNSKLKENTFRLNDLTARLQQQQQHQQQQQQQEHVQQLYTGSFPHRPPQAGDILSNCQDQDLVDTNENLSAQVEFYKNRTHQLMQELQNKDNVIADLLKMRDEAARKQRESPVKDTWFEHKLKLLKQDKRRRGETIGKLLKCIDDMRDTGRLDPSKVTEGRAVLAASLASYGLPFEERIRNTVKAVELDRVPRVPPTEDNNSNASANPTQVPPPPLPQQQPPPPPTPLPPIPQQQQQQQQLQQSRPSSMENQNNSARAACSSQALLTNEDLIHLGCNSREETDEESEFARDDDPPPVGVHHPLSHMGDGEILQVANDIANEYGFTFHFRREY